MLCEKLWVDLEGAPKKFYDLHRKVFDHNEPSKDIIARGIQKLAELIDRVEMVVLSRSNIHVVPKTGIRAHDIDNTNVGLEGYLGERCRFVFEV